MKNLKLTSCAVVLLTAFFGGRDFRVAADDSGTNGSGANGTKPTSNLTLALAIGDGGKGVVVTEHSEFLEPQVKIGVRGESPSLRARLADYHKANPEGAVTIKADESVSVSAVAALMRECSEANVTDIALVVGESRISLPLKLSPLQEKLQNSEFSAVLPPGTWVRLVPSQNAAPKEDSVDSGPLAQFGLGNGGGAIGPHGPALEHGSRTRKVIFVCDGSGSMLNKMPTLRQQLMNAIHNLVPIQSFNVIFFCDGPKLLAFDSDRMVTATSANQQKAQAFLDNVAPTGQTDPFPALELAFRQQPELLYLLSNGALDANLRTNPEILAEVGKLEAACGNKVQINTIMFDDDSPSGRELLTRIAKEHGGHYLFVKESDLKK